MPTPTKSFQLGAIDEFSRSVRAVASTRDLVQSGETDADGVFHPYLESLDSWDLTRFLKNPVVLWQHDTWSGPIGLADEVQETDRGLEMRINFAAQNVEPKAEEAFKRVRAGLVRGVSVGFDYGDRTDEPREGDVLVVRFAKNVLCEVSLVSVPADENALVDQSPPPILSDSERAKRRASNAGRDLAKHRMASKRTDGSEEETVQRFDSSRIGKLERTQVGGIRAPARLARTGVLVYRNADGSQRRELRLDSEVFNENSLATLRSAPVTDLAHHGELIGVHNWKDATLGHVENVRNDGKYIAGELLIQDAKTIADVENGRLSDISAGYRCRLDWTSGTHDGEPYDAIQRDIKYNHVAVLPPGRGRSGTDVGLRLDAADVEDVEPEQDTAIMADPITKILTKLDGKDVEYGSAEHIKHLETAHIADLSRFDAKEKEHAKKLDELQARCDAADADKKRLEGELAAAKDPKALEARVSARVAVQSVARDALGEKATFDGKDDRAIMIDVIRTDAAFKEFDGKDKSDDYVSALYDSISKRVTRSDGIDSVVKAHQAAKLVDSAVDPATAARAAMIQRNREASSKPL